MSKQKSCRTCIYGPVPIPGERCQYRCAPHDWAEYVDDGSVIDADEPARMPGWADYVDDHAVSGALQDGDEDRIDIIGQNGNTGEHYSAIFNPEHYTQGKIECIDAIESALTPEEFRGYCKGNIMKYVWREQHKGGVESLEKAAWYLERMLPL